MSRYLLISLGFFLGAVSVAAAQSTPSRKPDKLHVSESVSTRDAETLYKALRAADESRWDQVAGLQAQAQDERVRDIILWRRASGEAPDMGFDDVTSAMSRLQGWPMLFTMRRRAEELIDYSALAPADRINWLEDGGPVSGPGFLALAKALQREGRTSDAEAHARTAWREHSLDESFSDDLLRNFSTALSQDDHRARAEFLLWTNQRSAARDIRPYLTSDWQRLVDARIALAAGQRGVDRLIEAVPGNLQSNPGLLYERAQWRRKRGNLDGAIPLLVGIDGRDVPEAGRSRLWGERHIATRESLEDRRYQTAYSLAAPHGMDRGVDFAEAEWLAGWISLRFLNEPARARDHFVTLEENVSSPISKARANYWAGRAEEVIGTSEAAATRYLAAGEHDHTFYGQLARQAAGGGEIKLTPPPPPTDEERAAFHARPVVQALKLIGETGFDQLFRRFAFHIDDEIVSAHEVALLAEISADYQMADVGVRAGKEGLAKSIVEPDAAYPVVSYPLLREPNVERPLMLALARQESEMNPSAISHANARGLMQFIPATASRQARISGLPYRTSWLTDDPAYNMTLGGAHLDDLLGRFNGSYVMTAAAYNAGPTRVRQWLNEYGDPRTGSVDFLDWIELIPFSETRNYVQRVIENTQVYRHRLTGQPAAIRTKEDIERGRFR